VHLTMPRCIYFFFLIFKGIKMHNSKLESNGGQKYLVCYYHKDNMNFTEIIRGAFTRHKIDDAEAVTIPVLVLPTTQKENDIL